MGVITRITDFLARRHRGVESPEQYYELKQAALERVLGTMHGYVAHAVVPYELGGPVDMYYFPQSNGSTALATMELLNANGSSPKCSRIGTYELVAFTRHAVKIPEANPPFDDISLRIRRIFTTIGRYSSEAILNPLETAELPGGDAEPTPYLLFDEFARPGVPFQIGRQRHSLLLCVEVHPEELAFAKANGTAELIARLTQAGHYPCSDLDRPRVV